MSSPTPTAFWEPARQAADEILCRLSSLTHLAANALNDPLPSPWDVPGLPHQTTPPDPAPWLVLGHLAALAVMARDNDPRAAAIREAIPLLERRRCRLGLPVVTVGPAPGTSVAAAALWAARGACSHLGGNFGCGRLLGIVLNVCQGFEAVVHLHVDVAVAWALDGRSPALLRITGERFELARRLLSYDADKWFTPIDMPSICRWARGIFGRVDWFRLREALKLEFAEDAMRGREERGTAHEERMRCAARQEEGGKAARSPEGQHDEQKGQASPNPRRTGRKPDPKVREETERILQLKAQNKGYKSIAREMHMNESAVRQRVRRHKRRTGVA
jgi:hypothetical protein